MDPASLWPEPSQSFSEFADFVDFQQLQDSAHDTKLWSREDPDARRLGLAFLSTLTFASANLIEHDAPVLATLERSIHRSTFDLRGPGALHPVFRLFQTCQQVGGENGALIRLEFKGLSQDTVCSVSHVTILLQPPSHRIATTSPEGWLISLITISSSVITTTVDDLVP